MTAVPDSRFHDSTRGRVAALLRAGPRTVDELAAELQLTDNAIRAHLTALERDGMVRQTGIRRGAGAGKPAVLFELDPGAEWRLSRAYAPVLSALLEVLTERLTEREAKRVLRETGRRLAIALGGRASGDLPARANAAAAVLNALGGMVEVESKRGSALLRGRACPLSTAVRRAPSVCAAVESLVAEISGTEASECCDRAERPRCCFELRRPA